VTETVAMLHTSFVFVNVDMVFKDLFAELLPNVTVVDFVDSQILATVQQEGSISSRSIRRMCYLAQAAEAAQATVIFSACSSLGPAIDVARKLVSVPIVKVDDQMAREVVRRSDRIGVLATVPSTLDPTVGLIQTAASSSGRSVKVTPMLAKGAFAELMSGNREQHDAMISVAAEELARGVDLIVLAQASMARLAPRLASETGHEVLSSPRLGVQELARVLSERVAQLA
jgi:Asp/Glu/hydantoin racemase